MYITHEIWVAQVCNEHYEPRGVRVILSKG
eukprot:SAG11_NODE_12719_length_688_cov_15.281834_1_plen_29_part_01